jgi:hypothetical protein
VPLDHQSSDGEPAAEEHQRSSAEGALFKIESDYADGGKAEEAPGGVEGMDEQRSCVFMLAENLKAHSQKQVE